MFTSILHFLVSAALIVVAGGFLTQFGDLIANRTRLGSVLVGGILIAGATSLPELAIDISAVQQGSANLAAGDLFGSNLLNLLILAVCDLTHYSRGQMLSRASASHALAAGTSIVLAGLAALFIHVESVLPAPVVARLGPGSIAILIAYVAGIRLIYHHRHAQPESRDESDAVAPWLSKLSLKGVFVGFAIAAAAILASGPFLASAAGDLAERSGLGGTFFGSTAVGLCTSLPEVVTVLAAVRIKAFGMAIGNIFGSNCFNMVIFFPLDLVDEGSLLASVETNHIYTALCFVVVTAVVSLGQLFNVESKKPFREPDALLTILLILGSLTGLYFVSRT